MAAASHAWAEAHIDGLGWVGFDAANKICPDERYVRIATGLDYTDTRLCPACVGSVAGDDHRQCDGGAVRRPLNNPLMASARLAAGRIRLRGGVTQPCDGLSRCWPSPVCSFVIGIAIESGAACRSGATQSAVLPHRDIWTNITIGRSFLPTGPCRTSPHQGGNHAASENHHHAVQDALRQLHRRPVGEPVDGRYFDDTTPITGGKLCEIARSTRRTSSWRWTPPCRQDKWGRTPVAQRALILNRIADRMESNLELLAQAETWTMASRCAKPWRPTFRSPSIISAISPLASVRRKARSAKSITTRSPYHFHEPLGVVGQIIPWNFPDPDGRLEARAGARRRQLRGAEAGRTDAASILVPPISSPTSCRRAC